MYLWGKALPGELSGQEQQTSSDTLVVSGWSRSSRVVQAACGESHSLLITDDGQLYSCGNNDHGQLGHGEPSDRPQAVSLLSAYRMRLVACGSEHSLAVSEWGQTFSWGGDSCGQLGAPGGLAPSRQEPKILRALGTHHVVQITAGSYHNLALTQNGELYAWGANSCGQLGIGRFSVREEQPTLVESLAGVPLAQLATGGHHTFVLTKSGGVYAWGKNSRGQLGLSDSQDRCFPTHLKSLRSIKVCHISCGEEFTAFLTLEGGVLTCGAGSAGQLGHGDTRDELFPRKIIELMGSVAVQAVCGRRNLYVVTGNGRMEMCGLWPTEPSGATPAALLPRRVQLPVMDHAVLGRVFGGALRFLLLLQPPGCAAHDGRLREASTQILTVDPNIIKYCLTVKEADQVDQDTLCYLETVFKSLACLNASFLTSGESHYCCNSKSHGVDMLHAEQVFEAIDRITNSTIKEVILQSISQIMQLLRGSPPDAEALRALLTLPLYGEMRHSRHTGRLQAPLAGALLRLRPAPRNLLAAWYRSLPIHRFTRLVDVFKNVIHSYLNTGHFKDCQRIMFAPRMMDVLNALDVLNKMNLESLSARRAPPEAFYIHDLGDMVNIQQDYLNWLTDVQMSEFYLCNYPFLFDALCKTSLLVMDQAIQMTTAMRQANSQALASLLLQGHAHPATHQFVVLNVSREHIVADTLRELSQYGISDLKKPLKVKFHEEEAEDAGGVRKEFFMLLLREILDPKYGMFHHYPDTRTVWFAEDSFEDADMYLLIGVICGLAIYNFTIINVPFPLALYKKLLKATVGLEDLRELSPVLARSLQQLLDHETNDVEQVFCLNFEISRETCGEVRIHPLKDGGSEIPVTNENRAEYVDLYVDFIFNTSIQKMFTAFYDGFYRVCGGRVLKLFEPAELMALVVGNEEYDWGALEQAAEYRGGYTAADPNIQAFWEVLRDLPLADKKNFLLFLTGSDRIPIQGMKAIKVTIQPTADDRFLPVAHTCFNLLDLPRYSTKEKLRYKLLQAIQQTQGFSLV